MNNSIQNYIRLTTIIIGHVALIIGIVLLCYIFYTTYDCLKNPENFNNIVNKWMIEFKIDNFKIESKKDNINLEFSAKSLSMAAVIFGGLFLVSISFHIAILGVKIVSATPLNKAMSPLNIENYPEPH